MQLGEAYSSSIINAVMHSPAWPKTVLFFMYDEHGGYYDHVRAARRHTARRHPARCRRRARRARRPGTSTALRVPAFVISPFAKRNHVSHVVHDHTSVLKFIETKFNLGALTRRDANADSLASMLGLQPTGRLPASRPCWPPRPARPPAACARRASRRRRPNRRSPSAPPPTTSARP